MIRITAPERHEVITYLFFFIQISERAKLFANFVLGVELAKERKGGRDDERPWERG